MICVLYLPAYRQTGRYYLLLPVARPPILLSWFCNFCNVALFFLADLTAEAILFFAEILDLVDLI